VVDYFTPTDQQSFTDNDVDFGIAGPLLLPPQSGSVPNELIGGGKSAVLYVLNRSNMGKYCASCNPPDSQVVQTVSSSELFAMYSTPAYWNGFVYQSSNNGPLLAFKLAKGKLSANPVAQTSVTFNYQGSTPVVSSNGPKKGIVWILLNGNGSGPSTVLYAFRATDLTELYDSSQVAGDAAGPGVKFTVPTVANGRIYVGTQTELDVYGMFP
jgi:outer membrane protein assembly factor BamB